MDTPLEPSPLQVFGQWFQQLRLSRHLSRAALSQPAFSPGYIEAIEHGAVRLSLQAWSVFAQRLGVSKNLYSVETLPYPDTPDVAALSEGLTYQLDYLKTLIQTQRGLDARQLMAAIAQEARLYWTMLSVFIRYRVHRLQALTYLASDTPAPAFQELEQALLLAQQLDNPQEEMRTHNALGAAYYQQDLPDQALTHHLICLRAIHNKEIKDPALRLSIYGNLANDYLALNDLSQAIGMYQEARSLLKDLNAPAQEAAVCWGLSLAHKAANDPDRALLYASQALAIYEQAKQEDVAAQMRVNLAELLQGRKMYEEAAALLEQARLYQLEAKNDLLLGSVYEQYALLELERAQLVLAAQYAEDGCQRVARLVTSPANANHADGHAHAVRTYARLLGVAGSVAERQDDQTRADTQFQHALNLLEQTEYTETLDAVASSYADVLVARGDHQRANFYYRLAAQSRQRRTRH